MERQKKGNVIFHVDVNSAFLSWEAVYRMYHLGETTDLRKQVSAVGGDAALRYGIILAKSIPARRYRIMTGKRSLKQNRNVLSLYWCRRIMAFMRDVQKHLWIY